MELAHRAETTTFMLGCVIIEQPCRSVRSHDVPKPSFTTSYTADNGIVQNANGSIINNITMHAKGDAERGAYDFTISSECSLSTYLFSYGHL